MGRKSKILDENTRGTIVKYIKNGNYIKTACLAAGISERAYYDWVARGENPKGGEDEIYVQFLQELKKAEAENITKNIQNIQDAGNRPQTWMASAWLLERKYPADFGRRIELEVGPSKVLLALQEQAQRALNGESREKIESQAMITVEAKELDGNTSSKDKAG